MNEFTKAELIDLNIIVILWNLKFGNDEKTKILESKIQSVIDNYWVHESDEKDYCPALYDKICSGDEIIAVDLNRVKKCIKCYRYFE